ncbi:response regulator [Enterococcus gallinarum]|uniref:response regulator transcription factor n=1 Tax=Enterococcus gallinarum TaxID=1353 RepID=UPI0012E1E551|nr:response regulator [Enterococcus gallinarum]MUN91557.1 response regulator [Enterococcus gallinarum]
MHHLHTVLLVDDETTIRDGLKHMIRWEQEGFRLLGDAANGQEALTLIQQLQPEIVITDLKMPQMDGIQLTTIIQQQYPSIHFLVLSSYDDFHYVSQSFKNGAIDYLLKPTLTPALLLKSLNTIREKISDTRQITAEIPLQESLNRYLAGYEEPLTPFADYLEIAMKQQLCFLYTNVSYFRSTEQLFHALTEFSQSNSRLKTLAFKTSNNDAGLLISYAEESDFFASLKNCLDQLNYTEPNAFFTLGCPFESIEDLRSAFLTLKDKSREQSFFYKQQRLVLEQELFLYMESDRFDTKKFLRALLDNNFLLGITRIEDYFNEMILSNVDPNFLKQQASSIFYTLLSRLEEEFPTASRFSRLRAEFLHEIGHVLYLEDFSDLLLSTIDEIRLQLTTLSPMDEDDLLVSIQRFIQDNYMKSLSLSELAETFHFSYTYLSAFLSSKLKMSFSDYLKNTRLEKAKELLTQSELNLSEISEAVGYSDISYFSRIFKKEFQVTPSKYRRLNQL